MVVIPNNTDKTEEYRLNNCSTIVEPQLLCQLDWVKGQKRSLSQLIAAQRLKIVDLFAGIGGMTLGACEAARINERAIEISCCVEINKTYAKSYYLNFAPEISRLIADDVRSIDFENELKVKQGEIDVLLAGPPCQGHSNLNNRTRRNDHRNELYFEVVRVAEQLQPAFLLIENVTGVVHDLKSVVSRSVEALELMGYHVKILNVNAQDFGVAQTRKRSLLIASKVAFDEQSLAQRYTKSLMTLQDTIGDLIDASSITGDPMNSPSQMSEINLKRAQYLLENNLYCLPNELRPACHRDKAHSYKSMYGRLSWDKPAQTLTSGFGSMGQGRFMHPSLPRTITPREAARIQSIPDFYNFNECKLRGQLQTAIANVVPPPIIATILDEAIRQKLI